MTAALRHCQHQFRQSHASTKKNQGIYEAFEALEADIAKLSDIEQINLYSASTQFLDSLLKKQELVNTLEVFTLRCNSIIASNESARKIGLSLAVLLIAIASFVLLTSIGIGISVLMGVWSAPMMFIAAFLAAETSPVLMVGASAALGIGAGVLAIWGLFRERAIEKSLYNCVEAVKEHHLAANEEFFEKEVDAPFMEIPNYVPSDTVSPTIN